MRRWLFKGLALIIGIVAIVLGFQERRAINRVRSVGHVAVVQPIDGYTSRKSKGTTTYLAEFTFKTDKDETVTKKRSFPEELIQDFKGGVPVKVLYDPAHPYDFVFEKETASWMFVAIGAVFIVVALVFV